MTQQSVRQTKFVLCGILSLAAFCREKVEVGKGTNRKEVGRGCRILLSLKVCQRRPSLLHAHGDFGRYRELEHTLAAVSLG